MSPTNIPQKSGQATFVVKVNGSAISDEMVVLSVRVEKQVNRITHARIVILDGEADTETFPASSSAIFVPGNSITVEAGYNSTNQVIFTGIITAQSLRIDSLVGSALEVECQDVAVRMTVGRKNATYANQKDSDIMSAIIGSYSGLTAAVSPTSGVHSNQVQYYVTDWDFINCLAQNNGLIVTTINGTVGVASPSANTAPLLAVNYGSSLIAFNAKMDAVTQLGNVTSVAWESATQSMEMQSASSDSISPSPGNISTKTLSQVIGANPFQQQTGANLAVDALQQWSDATIMRSEYAKILGDATFQGSALAEPGSYITLSGLGDRFNGDYFVSGVVQTLSDGNWITEVRLGLSPELFAAQPDVMAPSASGLVPGASGLLCGTVKKIDNDPDGQFRILVDVPLFDTGGEGVWARISNFYATNRAGAFFLPEVGDEVVLGFLNEDPRNPIVLGSMYSKENSPYFPPNQTNNIKGIVTKSGLSVQFDDENKAFRIHTPGGNQLLLSDNDASITIRDQNSNSIVLSNDGITISSPKNISLNADGQIKLNGNEGIQLQSNSGVVATNAMIIQQTAAMQFSASGGTMTSISAGAELSLKGGIVMIN